MSKRLEPVLPGNGASDYERYLRTDELLALQSGPDEQVHHDELLFQTVHQASELWLKHAATEMEEATRLIDADDHGAAIRLLRRACLGLKLITEQLEMLDHLSPWEYHVIRRRLGHGSGFDSPGFRRVRRHSPALGRALREAIEARGLTLGELYKHGRDHEDLYQLAELVIEWDERVSVWRYRHYKVISRVIGAGVVGTQGTPVEVLARMIRQTFFPDLQAVRNELTQDANELASQLA